MIKENRFLGYREQLNGIDSQLLFLLEKRFGFCKKIGVYKKQNNLPIEDMEREKQIIERLSKKTKLSREFIKDLFNLIFKESKKVQNEN